MKRLKTRWAEQMDPDHVLPEYPRPALRRESFVNLNGMWEYAMTRSKTMPEKFEGEILVPFSPEAPLSGVGRQLKPRQYLWYRRKLPGEIKVTDGKRWILHFGAVDQYAVVAINGHVAARHLGGYLPFDLDITDELKNTVNELTVRVQDYTDYSYCARGKQKLMRGGMFYTAQSGIWQTVWMEQIPAIHIDSLQVIPRYDEREVEVTVNVRSRRPVEVTVSSPDMQPVSVNGRSGQPVRVAIPKMQSWSPEHPYLYDLHVTMEEDEADSYFAMRKICVKKDREGIARVFLNDRPYFQKGVLDQGYWPDGLYTAPSDEAMIFDIAQMKRLGFNMLRKHVKIEPQRWYYHCDRLGMLVWQDMVCGGEPYRHGYVTYAATVLEVLGIHPKDNWYRLLGRRKEQSRNLFVREMKETIRHLSHHPSIVTWVIFNEGWGQFDAKKMTEIARSQDSTRLIDQASGWFDQGGGDFRSIHNYFFPYRVKAEERATALTEFGGFCLKETSHSMYPTVYGYRIYRGRRELTEGYHALLWETYPRIRKGLSATIYTQLCDVEEEVNGLYTYDREVLKIDEKVLKEWNRKLTLS